MDYIKKDDVLELLNKNSITKIVTLVDGISIYDSVKNLRTADAVPSEELELWQNERFNYYQRSAFYWMTRQKIAREIFEEIENNLKELKDDYRLLDDMREVCAVRYAMARVAELKKKYTEGDNE
jgi:hypothetical protein